MEKKYVVLGGQPDKTDDFKAIQVTVTETRDVVVDLAHLKQTKVMLEAKVKEVDEDIAKCIAAIEAAKK